MFELAEMDVCPLKLASRLERVGARVVICHTHPHAESPPRRLPASSRPSDSAAPGEQAPPVTRNANEEETLLQASEEETLPLRPDASERTVSINLNVSKNNGTVGGDTATSHPRETAGAAIPTATNMEGISSTTARRTSKTETVAETDEFKLGPPRRYTSAASGQEPVVGRSPALPGPSPAGWASPVWTFDGRIPSSGQGPPSGKSAVGPSDWRKRRMWSSDHISSGLIDDGVKSTPPDGPQQNATVLVDGRGSRLKQNRHMLRKRSSSLGSGSGSCRSSATQPGLTSKSRVLMAQPVDAFTSAQTKTGSRAAVHGHRGQGRAFPPYETESESDDQLGVRASAFGGSVAGRGGIGLNGPDNLAYYTAGAQANGSSSARSGQWVVEMEMAFEQERRRWQE